MTNKTVKSQEKETVTVFFAADDRYLAYLSVALLSLSKNASDKYIYDVKILSSEFSQESLSEVVSMVKPNIKISVCDLSERIRSLKESLAVRLRDYYSESIYYRMFIPSMFENLSKAVYLDSDIVLCDDVAKLYFAALGDNLLGAITDESVITVPIFCDYVKRHIGVTSENEYFNSGVLVMNLDKMREEKIEEKFKYLLIKHNFNTVAPDQDYLNFLCRGRVLYLDSGWNKHAIEGRDIPKEQLHLVHFNMFNKPWHYFGVPMEEHFWAVARRTPFYAKLLSERANYTDEKKDDDIVRAKRLLESAEEIYKCGESINLTVTDGFFESLGFGDKNGFCEVLK